MRTLLLIIPVLIPAQQESRAARSRAISKVVALFKRLDVDVLTKWRQAQAKVIESDEWQEDEEFRKLPMLDILLAFEDYSRVREREFEEQMRRAQVEKTRKERKAREAFKAGYPYSCLGLSAYRIGRIQDLLRELTDTGKIKARTKWKDIYPSFSKDARYLNMLGNPGSNPLELFWDVVDGLDQRLDAKVAVVEAAVKNYSEKFPILIGEETQNGADPSGAEGIKTSRFVPETTKEELLKMIEDDEGVKALSEEDIDEIYHTVRIHCQVILTGVEMTRQ